MVREITHQDFDDLMRLYTQLHDNPFPKKTDEVMQTWERIVSDSNHHIIVDVEEDVIVSSCVCVIIQNMTHVQRPYALIENVITDCTYRKKGYATKCLDYAKEIAQKEKCYKTMLLTGSNQESTLNFYEQVGYNRKDKTAFVQWL